MDKEEKNYREEKKESALKTLWNHEVFLNKGKFLGSSLAEAPAWGEGAVDESSRRITHPYPPQQPAAGVSLREENTSFSLWEAKLPAVTY